MAKAFLASVGNGILMGRVDGELQMMAHVNTLTESTLSITSTQEEVRAGQGAKLYGRFNHDAGLTVTLTDAMFDLNYIALQVGSELQHGGITMHTEQVVATSEDWSGAARPTLRVSKPIQQMGESCGFDKYFAWFRKAGCDASDEYTSATYLGDITAQAKLEKEDGAYIVMKDGFVIQSADENLIKVGETYCVSYFTTELSAKTVMVNANFVPAELSLILTTKLFAGDANNPETGRPVGEITIKVPRFSLDGAFDLSMAMSSAATMSLNGTALATAANDCDGEGVYAEIVEVVNGVKWYDDVVELRPDLEDVTGQALDDGTYEVLASSVTPNTTIIDIWAVHKDTLPQIVPTYYLAVDSTSGATFYDAEGGAKGIDKYTGAITASLTGDAADTLVIVLNKTLDENKDAPADLKCTIKFVKKLTNVTGE